MCGFKDEMMTPSDLMFGVSNNNPAHPVFFNENRLQFENSKPNQLQLFQNFSNNGCNVDPMNFFGKNEQNGGVPTTLCLNKRNRDTDGTTAATTLKNQRLRFSLNSDTICRDEPPNPLGSVTNPNPVSTGLRLSYDDDEHNSSVTSASGNLTVATPIISSLRTSIGAELNRQKDELDHYIKSQQEEMAEGLREIKKRQTAAFMGALEWGIRKRLQEKEVEIESMGCRNRELAEKVKQVGVEAQGWQYRARYSESVVGALRTSLQQVVSQGGVAQGKEGFGDSEADDAASFLNGLGGPHCPPCVAPQRPAEERAGKMVCKGCRRREVGVLLMPCRHLCLCLECDDMFDACPICGSLKSASIHVFLG